MLSQLKDPEGFLRKVRELYAEPDAESHDVLEFLDGRVFERYSQPQRVEGINVGRVWSFRDVTERRRLDEMKDSFLSAVSHELRTPLAAVVGFAATLQQRDGALQPDERARFLERLGVNALKLERLLTDILDVDRLDRGILQPRRQPTDLGALVRRVLRDGAGDGRTIDVVDEGVVAWLDPAKVERIVENLLINAVRHTPSHAHIWIRVSWEGPDSLLVVEDDGPGVPEELRGEIFESFRQGPTAPSHSPGVGIGLALVARFAELHGGTAWVEERPGGGAAFHVRLPSPASAHASPNGGSAMRARPS